MIFGPTVGSILKRLYYYKYVMYILENKINRVYLRHTYEFLKTSHVLTSLE